MKQKPPYFAVAQDQLPGNDPTRKASHKGLVWHYATWISLSQISESGALFGSNAQSPMELPMLWFSANQVWEPTATKAAMDSRGNVCFLTFTQQVELFGCVRFGLAADDPRLLNWRDACTVARTPREQRKALEKSGKKMGGNPQHWTATIADVSLSELVFQVWVGQWGQATSIEGMVDAWESAHGPSPEAHHARRELRKAPSDNLWAGLQSEPGVSASHANEEAALT